MTFQQWKRSEWAAYWWAGQKAVIIRFSPFEFGVHLPYQVIREYGEKVLKDPYWDIPF